jgi:hypothetical protein
MIILSAIHVFTKQLFSAAEQITAPSPSHSPEATSLDWVNLSV